MYDKKVSQSNLKGNDRRSQRSQHALIDALIELMAEKSYDSISIKEIVEKANVGRSTFYAHYQTKDDLVRGGFELILDETLNQIVYNDKEDNLTFDLTMFFKHAEGHYQFYKNLMWGSGYKILTQDELVILSEKIQQRFANCFSIDNNNSVPLNILSYSFSGSLFILLKWWLDNKMPLPPEKMNNVFQILVMPGIKSALGMRVD